MLCALQPNGAMHAIFCPVRGYLFVAPIINTTTCPVGVTLKSNNTIVRISFVFFPVTNYLFVTSFTNNAICSLKLNLTKSLLTETL